MSFSQELYFRTTIFSFFSLKTKYFYLLCRQETERQTVEELRNNISLLEHEKREKAVDRIRYEKEIEQLEENWKKESQELLGMITRLQEDNKKLSLSLKERTEKNVSQSRLT